MLSLARSVFQSEELGFDLACRALVAEADHNKIIMVLTLSLKDGVGRYTDAGWLLRRRDLGAEDARH